MTDRDLLDDLQEATYSFDSHNYVTQFDCELLDRTITELQGLRGIERQVEEIRQYCHESDAFNPTVDDIEAILDGEPS